MTIAAPGQATQILDGIRVVELTDVIAGPFAGKLLADLGADVLKIEPLAGDSARRHGPFLNDVPQRETSAIFLQYNTNKRSVRLNVATRAGRRLLQTLLDHADVFLYDLPPALQSRYRLTPAQLRQGRARLIVTSLTPYGLSGPSADLPSSPLTRMHSAGAPMNLIRIYGSQAVRPVSTGAYVNEADCGMACALATVAALIERGAAGDGQVVEVSAQEALMALDRVDLSVAYNDPPNEPLARGRAGPRMACSDGYVIVAAILPKQWRGMAQILGDPGWAFDGQGELKDGLEDKERLRAALDDWAAGQTRDAVYRAAQAHSLPVGPIHTPSEVLRSEQERQRGFFECISHPRAGELEYTRFASVFADAPAQPRRPAPLLGADSSGVLPAILGGWNAAQARRAGVA